MPRSSKELNQQIGARIRLLRTIRGLTQKELGKAVFVSVQQIQKYETGKNDLSPTRLLDIAATLGVSAGDLLGISNEVLLGIPNSLLEEKRETQDVTTLPASEAGAFLQALDGEYAGIIRNLRFVERRNKKAFTILCGMVAALAAPDRAAHGQACKRLSV